MAQDKHRIADRWRDCVVVCSCGWRTASKTMKAAETEWREHRAQDRLTAGRPLVARCA